jgi:hypothetical protein
MSTYCGSPFVQRKTAVNSTGKGSVVNIRGLRGSRQTEKSKRGIEAKIRGSKSCKNTAGCQVRKSGNNSDAECRKPRRQRQIRGRRMMQHDKIEPPKCKIRRKRSQKPEVRKSSFEAIKTCEGKTKKSFRGLNNFLANQS